MNDKIVFTRREKTVLLAIKSGFAFMWGFINVVTILQSRRVATMMTGNLILLGRQIQDWDVEEIMLTFVLIIAYILGGAAYDALNFVMKEEKNVLLCSLSAVVILGVLADIVQYVTTACPKVQDQSVCEGRNLYYLSPVSFMTGIVASGYCSAHLMTGRMTVAPGALLKIYLTEGYPASGPERARLLEEALLSVVLVTLFFLGVLTGAMVEGLIVKTYLNGRFSPLFTAFAIVLDRKSVV